MASSLCVSSQSMSCRPASARNGMKKNEQFKTHPGSLVIPGGRVGVLLIHSLGGTPIELRFVAQALARCGYTVYCPLLPGLGGGTDVLGLSSWKDWYAGIESAYEQLKQQCEIILVGGISAGGILALRLAAKHPETVHGVMLFAPTIWPNGWAIPWYFNLFKIVRFKQFARLFHFRQRAPFGIKDERIRRFVVESLKDQDRAIEDLFGRGGGIVLEFHRLVREVKKQLGAIRQQTLIFHPREDDQSDLKNAVMLQRKLGGLVEMCVLEDSYHMVTLDRQRTFVVDRTVEFAVRVTQRLEEAAAVQRIKAAAAAAE
jgi:carboxylesterase